MFARSYRAGISLFLIVAIYVGVLAPLSPAVLAQKVSAARGSNNKPMGEAKGLEFRLSEGTEGAETRTTTPPAKTDPLSQSQSENLLKRIPPVKKEGDDEKDFAIRDRSLPAPKTGKVNPIKFPSAEDRAQPANNIPAKLEVLRYSPSGEVSIAPEMTVTFSQPMVAITSQEQAAETVPVKLTPEVKGRWRWLGTKTLMFDAEQRFPQATKFTAVIPAGTKSAVGGTLAKEVSWSFTTPPPKVKTMIPANAVTRRNALMYLEFDQEIKADLVLSKIQVLGGSTQLPLRFATQAEIDADSGVSYYVKQAQPRRWIAFRAVGGDGGTENALPPASVISVKVPAGTPSAEGPLVTTADQTYSFQTYSPMQFTRGYCGWYENKNCAPTENWYLEFNNQIDAESFDKSMITITPAVERLNIYPTGNYVYITGMKKGRTTYTVNIAPNIKDIYGQEMGSPAKTTIKVGSAPRALYSQGKNFVVLDPTAKPYFSVYSINHQSLKVKVYSVQPADWYAYRKYMRRYYDDEAKRPPIPGRLVVDRTVAVKNLVDEQVETRIDLADALNDGFGNAIVVVEPTVREDKYDRTRITAWAQATQIGLDAFVDSGEMVAMATALKDGKPLAGVELSIYPKPGVALKTTAQIRSSRTWWDWMMSWGSAQKETNGEEISDATAAENSEEQPAEEQNGNKTDDSGVLRFALPDSAAMSNMLIAKHGKDISFLPENTEYYWQESGSWFKRPQPDSLRWFTFTDRGIYKPKEEVSVKGWIRKIGGGKFGDVQPLGDVSNAINYSLRDARGNEVAKGDTTFNAFGGFDIKMTLPDNMNLGAANLVLTSASGVNGYQYYMPIQVQEFRRPEFEVKAQNETEAPYFVGGGAMVSVDAKYYAGGALQNADVNWTVTATPTNYTPPNRQDFTFGKWYPWWRSYNENNYGQTITQNFKGVTGADGKHRLKMDFLAANPARPYAVTANAGVMDVNRQSWASTTNLLVHPADIYVGIRTQKTFVQQNEKFKVEAIATGIDGEYAEGRDITIKAVLKDWVYDKGWKEKNVDEQTCTVKSAKDTVNCEFIAKQGGVYTITASVMDDKERTNESELTMWVAGGKTPPKREVEKEDLQIIPSKKDYSPGDVAELLVLAPFTPAEGVLTLRRSGIVKTERFTMEGSSKTLKIPLEDKYLPNIYAQVDLVGVADRTNDLGEVDKIMAKRPALASGSLNLPISTASRRLTVTAEPESKTLAPGSETTVNIQVKDSAGNPVANSEAAVIVVDEAVLSLIGYRVGDPIETFYSMRSPDVADYHSRESVLLGNPKDVKTPVQQPAGNGRGIATGALADSVSQVGGAREIQALRKAAPSPKAMRAEAANEAPPVAMDRDDATQPGNNNNTPIALRTNFNALASFSPSVKTDSNGRATVKVKLPDNLTRYRVTAVSVTTDKKFGGGESAITAKQPLMVRPSAPRFMNFGDKVDLPVVIQNQTDEPMNVDVVLRATNAEITNGNGRRVTIPANDRAEVRFPVAAMKAGTARFQFAVSAGKFSDAAEVELPVWTPATTEAFATYGTIDENGAAVQPVEAPKDVWPQFGGLEVTTSSTQLQELTDAFIYLYNYRFACSEQVSSRMLSVAALRDVLTAFKAKDMPTAAQIKAQFASDIQILKSRQQDDGGYGLWKRNERYKFPFVTAHVVHALARAKEKGYDVPQDMIDHSKDYLKNIERYYDPHWSPEVRWTISAYALYVRSKIGDRDIAKTKQLLKTATLEKLPFEATGWIYAVLAGDKTSEVELQAIRQWLNNHTTETAAAANFVTDYKDDGWVIMASNRRADGVILEAMIADQPQSDLVTKIVRGLLAHRTEGRWGNTQENVFILLALDKYFNTYEKVTPDFMVQAWLGNTFAGEQAFKGRSTDFNKIDVPMSWLMEQGGASNLILNKQGAGRLYYRIGMKYAPRNLKLEPADYGFAVTRQYEAVDNPDDVKRDADGTWVVKAGARVRVRLQMVATSRRYHVALVDQLPAGLEILNPELATTEAIPEDSKPNTSVTEMGSQSWGYNWWWSRYWFEHQNFRDERAEAFASLLWEGVYNYSFVTRATTPGVFVAPPAKAEEMYAPETFGRTGTDYVRVE
jgi:alpha-2-macroglobulin